MYDYIYCYFTLNIIKVILPDLIVMLQYQAIKVGMLDYLNSLLEEIINIPIWHSGSMVELAT